VVRISTEMLNISDHRNKMRLSTITKRLLFLAQFSDRVLSPVALLGARLLVANDFYKSGMLKLNYILDGKSDILYALFEDYNVPFLSVKVAAWTGMMGEVGLSTLFALGLLGRFGAFGLIFMSGVIYHTDQNELAPFWAIICAIILVLKQVKNRQQKASLGFVWYERTLSVLLRLKQS
jgi:uncharacterized membrane protein YphA (DoxX/SURF4 family)